MATERNSPQRLAWLARWMLRAVLVTSLLVTLFQLLDHTSSAEHGTSRLEPHAATTQRDAGHWATPFRGSYTPTRVFDHDGTKDGWWTTAEGERVQGPLFDNHPGIDWPMPEGTPVVAATGGRVVRAGHIAGWCPGELFLPANTLIIRSGEYDLVYEHNSVLLVDVGDTVQRGDIIALSGSTGCTSSEHLHFGVREVETRRHVDPFGPGRLSFEQFPGQGFRRETLVNRQQDYRACKAREGVTSPARCMHLPSLAPRTFEDWEERLKQQAIDPPKPRGRPR